MDIFGIMLHPIDRNKFYYYTILLYIFKFFVWVQKDRRHIQYLESGAEETYKEKIGRLGIEDSKEEDLLVLSKKLLERRVEKIAINDTNCK
jgi:hypothetical protein